MGDHPIKREFDEAYSLVDLKASDYAEDTNYFSNFEFAAKAAGITVDQVFLVMMGIKLARLAQLVGNDKEPNFESIDDTLLDAINYPGLLKAYRRQRMVDMFMAEEDEGFGGVLESDYEVGLIDAVLNDPINSMQMDTCGDPDCCIDYDPLFEDMWEEGDEFMLTDLNVYSGFGAGRMVVSTVAAGPHFVVQVRDDGVKFNYGMNSYYATWDEIEPV